MSWIFAGLSQLCGPKSHNYVVQFEIISLQETLVVSNLELEEFYGLQVDTVKSGCRPEGWICH